MTSFFYSLQTVLMRWMAHYRDAALWIERHGPSSDKVMHLNAGLILWVLTVLLRGRRWGDRGNLWPVVVFELLNETVDYIFPVKWSLYETLLDLAWTWFWPFVLVLLIGGGSGGRGGKRKRR